MWTPYWEDIPPPQRGSQALKESSERFYQDAAKPPVGLNQEVVAQMNIQYLNINSKPLHWVYLYFNVIRFPINKLLIKFTVNGIVFNLVLLLLV